MPSDICASRANGRPRALRLTREEWRPRGEPSTKRQSPGGFAAAEAAPRPRLPRDRHRERTEARSERWIVRVDPTSRRRAEPPRCACVRSPVSRHHVSARAARRRSRRVTRRDTSVPLPADAPDGEHPPWTWRSAITGGRWRPPFAAQIRRPAVPRAALGDLSPRVPCCRDTWRRGGPGPLLRRLAERGYQPVRPPGRSFGSRARCPSLTSGSPARSIPHRRWSSRGRSAKATSRPPSARPSLHPSRAALVLVDDVSTTGATLVPPPALLPQVPGGSRGWLWRAPSGALRIPLRLTPAPCWT